MPKSPYPMIAIETALTIIEQTITPLPSVTTPFNQALGLVLATAVQATEAMPPFPCASVDGYAVRAEDGPGWHTIVGDQMAGYIAEVEVTHGTAARVTTGAPIPHGATAMVMIEETEEQDGQVNIKTNPINSGAYIRPVGQDIEAGQHVLAVGTPLGPAELGLLATIGQTEIETYRRPKVAILSTGDELVEPHESLKPGQIRDANRFALMSLVEQAGAEPIDMGIIYDHEGGVATAIETALQEADVLLTSGGVSMGQLDLVKPYLAERGTIHFGRVNTKPGKPVTFATVDDKPCFALPGFPVSAMVSFEIFTRPALRKMMGHTTLYRPRQQAELTHHFHHTANRTEFQRVVLTRRPDGSLSATSTGFQGSGRLLSMRGANGLVILPHGHGDYESGSWVEAILLETV